MGKVKVLTARQAADLIKDGDTVTLSGFVANGIAEALNTAAEERFLETCLLYTSPSPRDP